MRGGRGSGGGKRKVRGEEKSEEGRREGERRERICFRERRGVKKRKERRRKWTLDALVLKSHW